MQVFQTSFLAFVSGSLQALHHDRIYRLLILAAIAEKGSGAWELVCQFRMLGILHLLILSGTQVVHVHRALSNITCVIGRCFPPSIRRAFVLVLTSYATWLFGSATGWSAALTRALILRLLILYLPRIQLGWLVGTTLCLQMLIFPEHLHETGFYVAWFAYLLVRWTLFWEVKDWQRHAVLALLCQGIVLSLLHRELPGIKVWFIWMFANVSMSYVFEYVAMPLLGYVLALAVLGSLIPHSWWWQTCLSVTQWVFVPGLRASGTMILVAIRGLGYIESL